ncbi:Ribosome associated membrane protein RAMP4 [Striga hermonthica]|uniref:Ribosome associated membrane protein RAMP4 n=1 Tax=Striga hermonthica TaxID=68872 RepID=A0A9N7R9F6_STRHE|nr:Ribosome associated membrane protein RAMP4 [Striga hermonthica]
MTVSKRLSEKKVAKFEKNITRRGTGASGSSKNGFEPAHIVLILFAVLVVASFIFQVVRMAISDGVGEENEVGS